MSQFLSPLGERPSSGSSREDAVQDDAFVEVPCGAAVQDDAFVEWVHCPSTAWEESKRMAGGSTAPAPLALIEAIFWFVTFEGFRSARKVNKMKDRVLYIDFRDSSDQIKRSLSDLSTAQVERVRILILGGYGGRTRACRSKNFLDGGEGRNIIDSVKVTVQRSANEQAIQERVQQLIDDVARLIRFYYSERMWNERQVAECVCKLAPMCKLADGAQRFTFQSRLAETIVGLTPEINKKLRSELEGTRQKHEEQLGKENKKLAQLLIRNLLGNMQSERSLTDDRPYRQMVLRQFLETVHRLGTRLANTSPHARFLQQSPEDITIQIYECMGKELSLQDKRTLNCMREDFRQIIRFLTTPEAMQSALDAHLAKRENLIEVEQTSQQLGPVKRNDDHRKYLQGLRLCEKHLISPSDPLLSLHRSLMEAAQEKCFLLEKDCLEGMVRYFEKLPETLAERADKITKDLLEELREKLDPLLKASRVLDALLGGNYTHGVMTDERQCEDIILDQWWFDLYKEVKNWSEIDCGAPQNCPMRRAQVMDMGCGALWRENFKKLLREIAPPDSGDNLAEVSDAADRDVDTLPIGSTAVYLFFDVLSREYGVKHVMQWFDVGDTVRQAVLGAQDDGQKAVEVFLEELFQPASVTVPVHMEREREPRAVPLRRWKHLAFQRICGGIIQRQPACCTSGGRKISHSAAARTQP